MQWQPVDPQALTMAEVVAYLRARCPWAAAHSHASLSPYLLEETYELLEAIEAYSAEPTEAHRSELIAELGDLAYQVFFHAAVLDAPQATPDAHHPPSGDYVPPAAIEQVLAAIHTKVVRRHPHVFASTGPVSIDEVEAKYEAVKAAERAAKAPHPQDATEDSEAAESGGQTLDSERTLAAGQLRASFDSIPKAMPALARAAAVLGRAERAGMTAEVPPPTLPAGTSGGDDTGTHGGEEADSLDSRTLGAELLKLVSRAHAAGLDPETALRAAVEEAEDRFVAAATPQGSR